MKKIKLIHLSFIFSLFFYTACIEVIELSELDRPTSASLVIEGLITNETKPHAVSLSRTKVADSNSTGEKVSGAKVEITDGINVFRLSEIDTLPGIYVTEPNVTGEIGKTYTLTVEVDQITYAASDVMQPVAPFEPVQALFEQPNRLENTLDNNTDIYDLRFPHVRYGVAVPSRQTLFAFDSIANGLRQAVFYEFPRIDPQGFLLNFAGSNPMLVVQAGTTILQSKSSLSAPHYEFVRAVYSETRFRGALFDNIPGNAPTNVSNGGKGFFGASAVISRTFTVTEANLDVDQ
ncbi:MAG: DUF4249 family protein [Bacteroidota bacterium]